MPLAAPVTTQTLPLTCMMQLPVLARHARPCAGHPRLDSLAARKTWMAGTSPAMTKKGKNVSKGLQCSKERVHVRSYLIQPLVARLTDRKRRHHVEHRCRKSGRAGECGRRADQHVDLHGAAEFVILQDRRLVVRRGAGARHALDLGEAAL